ncbi:DCP2-domain-containing protein [Patellaria atrata CBS 101060]|uniref:DCP2-domain-containing protein n=1 Tax=Patellaria atrata CBS 101060 TaxID=1346257 RepID=A0A9P4S412_9PEZI|nr:DCP2-domain-containing protein [Patellaria atrata CBS 101060]
MTKQKMQLVDWLDDLCVRFILNLPKEELQSVERICFQIEEAQWFYEDFIRPLDPSLPSMNLKEFYSKIFDHCPLTSGFSHQRDRAFAEFLDYKTKVPVRGAIMLNDDMDEVVLVKGWKKGSRWSFPRGKINKDEADLDCAIREVYEETGFNIREAGLVKNDDEMKFIQVTLRQQNMRLYPIRGVDMDTYFEPRTRKEISKIQWYKLSDLPTWKKEKQQQQGYVDDSLKATMFYMVAPFLAPLRQWIKQQRKQDRLNAHRASLKLSLPSSRALMFRGSLVSLVGISMI